MTRLMGKFVSSRFAKLSVSGILAAAAVGAVPASAFAGGHDRDQGRSIYSRDDHRDSRDFRGRDDHRDYDRDEHHDRGGADFRVSVGSDCPAPVVVAPQQVWVAPVYRTVCTPEWVAPVYRTVCDRVWREPVVRKECERGWVPEMGRAH